jgi:hypothetical protein
MASANAPRRPECPQEPNPRLESIPPLEPGDHYIDGSPEWVGEVSTSSVSFDLHTKFHVYRRNGVREYVVWRVRDQEVDWFVLQGSEFQRLAPDADGILRSRIFPGLWLRCRGAGARRYGTRARGCPGRYCQSGACRVRRAFANAAGGV